MISAKKLLISKSQHRDSQKRGLNLSEMDRGTFLLSSLMSGPSPATELLSQGGPMFASRSRSRSRRRRVLRKRHPMIAATCALMHSSPLPLSWMHPASWFMRIYVFQRLKFSLNNVQISKWVSQDLRNSTCILIPGNQIDLNCRLFTHFQTYLTSEFSFTKYAGKFDAKSMSQHILFYFLCLPSSFSALLSPVTKYDLSWHG